MVELVGHARSHHMPIRKSAAQVRALLTERIARGDEGYRPGDQLPTYDELVQELPASRATVWRAIKDLRDEGVLVGLRGGGVWVAENAPE